MREPNPESRRAIIPNEYFNIAPENPDLKGNLIGEIINEGGKPSLHLSLPDKDKKRPSRRQSTHGNGDILVMDISRLGWEKIEGVITGLGPDATMAQVANALTQQDFITWDRPSTGR